MVEKPQETNCTSIELPNEGVANGLLTHLRNFGYRIEYDEENDVYRVGEYHEEDDKVAREIQNG